MSISTVCRAFVAGCSILGAAAMPAWAQGASSAPNGAAPAGALRSSAAASSLGRIAAALKYSGAQYATGGVALRNRGAGSISISGAIAPIQKAYAYWAVITSGEPPAAVAAIQLQREFPLPASGTLTIRGVAVGSGDSPCWGGTGITVYRGAVPTALATGDGLYKVTLLSGASGLTDGRDPWTPPTVFPLFDGVSLVLVGSGDATVAIYDKGLAGATFQGIPGLTYSLALPQSVSSGTVLFDSIGADGQKGTGRLANASTANEITALNGGRIAGPSSAATDSDWNGGIGEPLPQLWDDVGHDITAQAPPATSALSFVIKATGTGSTDCLTPVANIVSFHGITNPTD